MQGRRGEDDRSADEPGRISLDLSAAVHETHIGVVLLLGDRGYKVKKPVRTGFLDFSTPQRRRAACEREVALNRRLAPDVYLGVAELTGPAPGTAEPVVVMHRMPGDRRLATLVRRGAPVGESLRALARQLAAFHAAAERGPHVDVEGGRDALRERWTANLDQTREFRGGVLDAEVAAGIEHLATRFLVGRRPLFDARVAAGRVVDGHGDLIADDVFVLDDGPRVLDCLEFDDRLRFVDGLDDVAFLAMDLERLGRADLSAGLLDAYAEFSADPAPAALRHHYVAYRAFVRAKVACLRHRQGDAAAAADVAGYAALAERRLAEGAVRLALVGGLPGTGKTTVGGGLADRFGAVLLSTDRIRKEMAGLDPLASAAAPYGSGLYSPTHVDRVYAEMLHRAGELLARGESVVLDASWTSDRHRRDAADLARRTCSDLVALRCQVGAQTARRRIAARTATASDATPAVAEAMAHDADPWPDAVAVGTDGSAVEALDRAAAVWASAARAGRPGGEPDATG